MDYTTISRVILEMRAGSSGSAGSMNGIDVALLPVVIQAASRAIDRELTGATDASAENYLTAGSAAGELLYGQVNRYGNITTWPRKPTIDTVSSFEYRLRPQDAWTAAPANSITIAGGEVTAWQPAPLPALTGEALGLGRCFVRVAYFGGLFTADGIGPADIVEAATVLAIRFYKEAVTGLGDAIGIAELATMIYTKAMPVRVVKMLLPWARVVGWRGIN